MQYAKQATDTGAASTPLMRCPEFEQRLLRPEADGTGRRDDGRDEVLYVLEGRGRATIGGETCELAPGTGAFVARGTAWSVDAADGLLVLSVLVEDPLDTDATHAVIGTVERGVATAGREFALFACPDNGCASVTQFVGHIPPGRAPDHFHLYDEVGYILSGEGAFHVGDESAPLGPGSCFHLPARLVHSLENFGPGEMQVLGVFRPAGSPAEAYYPDGTAAVVPVVA
ncbi:MAG TPA: cupin domain-containing protein [Gaiellaceae bacterium]|jgi:mannose-6-phosphate isomerase-like protein (cupin superfamily)